MRIIVVAVCIVCFLSGCLEHFLIEKKRINDRFEVIWTYTSDITNVTEYISIKDIRSGEEHLIFRGYFACGLKIERDTLKIAIAPRSYQVLHTENRFNIPVVIDSTCNWSSKNPKY